MERDKLDRIVTNKRILQKIKRKRKKIWEREKEKKYGYTYDFDYTRDKIDALFMINKLREKKTHDKTFENIKKFYINLDRNQERREAIEREFELYGMKNYERVSACDSKMVTSTYEGDFGDVKYINKLDERKEHKYRNDIEIAISCSHLKTIKKAYDENLEYAIIMEDDIHFTLMPYWEIEFNEILKTLPTDCDILLLTTHNVLTTKSKDFFVSRKKEFFTCAVCYLVTSKGMRSVVNKFFKNNDIYISENLKRIDNFHFVIDHTIWFNLDVYHTKTALINLHNFNHKSHFTQNSTDEIEVKPDYKILKDYCLKNRIINEDNNKMSRRLRRIRKDKITRPETKLLKYYPDDKFSIGFIIPVTSNKRNYQEVKDTDFFRILFPSFLKTVSSDTRYSYSFYLGYDDDDQFYLNHLEEMNQHFDNVSDGKYKLEMHPMSGLKGKVGQIWTNLALIASKDCDYLYQSGDDIEYLTPGWEDIFISELRKKDNIGVVGPYDTNRNIDTLLTQSFVHVTHLQIFGYYYPPEIENWYVDDWITNIYNQRSDKRIRVRNSGGPPRYKVNNDKKNYLNILRETRPKLEKFLEDEKLEKIKVFKTRQELYFVEDGILYIGSSRVTYYERELHENTFDDIRKKILR